MTTKTIKQAHRHDDAQYVIPMDDAQDALARGTDPETSHIAAASVDTERMQALVLSALRVLGSSTTEEISDYLDLRRDSVSPRMKPLVMAGKIERVGKKVGSTGRPSIVWGLTNLADADTAPAKVQRLRKTQRAVYDILAKLGDMTHGDLWRVYSMEHENDEQMMSESSVRTRCAELVTLDLVEKVGEREGIAVWGVKK